MSLELHGLWWLVLFLPLALGLTLWSYRFANPAPRGAAAWGLPLLRAAALGLVLVLLLEPVLVRRHNLVQPAVLAVLLDDSASIPFLEGRSAHGDWAPALAEALPGVEVEFLAFGDTTRALEPAGLDSLPVDQVNTDLDGALRILERDMAGRHLTGILLVSDGNSTRGPQPLARVDALDARLWTAVTGRRQAPRDLQLADLELNREVRLDLDQPVRIEVEAQGLEGLRARVSLKVAGVEQARQTLVLGPDGSRSPVDLAWRPRQPGSWLVECTVELEPDQGGEATLANNTRSALVRVRERGRQVTVLAAEPSPDLALLRRALEGEQDMELQVRFPDLRTGRGGPLDSLLSHTDLLVLVDWPRAGSSPGALTALRTTLGRVPALWLDRGGTRVESLGEGWPLVPGLPAGPASATLQAAAQAVHPVLGNLDRLDELQAIWREMPPITPARRSVRSNPGSRVLLAGGGQPLLALGDQAGHRKAVLAANGVWRWEIGSQLSLGPNRRARDLVVSLVRWLASDGDSRRFVVSPLDEQLAAGSPLRFQARVQGEDGRPRDRATVELQLTEANGDSRRVVLEGRGGGLYTGSSWGAEEGLLRWSAQAREGDLPVLADSGLVNIERWNGELRALKRNQALMVQLAQAGEGHCFDLDDPEQRAALARGEGFENLDRRPLERAQVQRLALREQLALLVVVLALLSAEWLWRKLQGLL